MFPGLSRLRYIVGSCKMGLSSLCPGRYPHFRYTYGNPPQSIYLRTWIHGIQGFFLAQSNTKESSDIISFRVNRYTCHSPREAHFTLSANMGPSGHEYFIIISWEEYQSDVWNRMYKSVHEGLNLLDVYCSLTYLLQSCRNRTFKYRKQKTILWAETQLRSPHSQHLWHHPVTLHFFAASHRSYPALLHQLPRFCSPLTLLCFTDSPALPGFYSPLLPPRLRTVHWVPNSPVKPPVPSSIF